MSFILLQFNSSIFTKHLKFTKKTFLIIILTLNLIFALKLIFSKDNFIYLIEYQFGNIDFLKIWLFLEGPHEVLKYINEKRGVEKKIVGHICYACAEIFKDGKNIQWIKDNYNEIMPSIMFKYLTLKTTLA